MRVVHWICIHHPAPTTGIRPRQLDTEVNTILFWHKGSLDAHGLLGALGERAKEALEARK
jgi:hypothetical protein